MEPSRSIVRRDPCPECGWFECPDGDCLFVRAMAGDDTRPIQVICFGLPLNEGERWNWPLRDPAAVDALTYLLDRLNIPWSVRPVLRSGDVLDALEREET